MLKRLFFQGLVGKPAPEIDAVEWLNSKPLSMAKLHGKVVLVDFWTYSCINCQKTLPHMKKWHEKYAKKGLVIIGVHTPEFDFEKDLENVKSALAKYGIKYPVAVDSDYRAWNNYRNRWWPRKFLVNKNGMIVYDHAGEGAYEETEIMIVNLLGLKKAKIVHENITGFKQAITPEIYCGILRNEGLGNGVVCLPGNCASYVDTKFHKNDTIYLDGEWMQHDECLENDKKRGHLALKYTASSVNAVMSSNKPAKAEILLDNKPLVKEIAGDDIVFEGKKSFAVVTRSDLYNLVKTVHGTHEIRIITEDRLRIYAFKFG